MKVLNQDRRLGTLSSILLAVTIVCTALPAVASDSREGQLRALFSPSPGQLTRGGVGAVFIYDGLPNTEVIEAIDDHFNRIQPMMFVRTVGSDKQGEPEADPVTSETETESDDC